MKAVKDLVQDCGQTVRRFFTEWIPDRILDAVDVAKDIWKGFTQKVFRGLMAVKRFFRGRNLVIGIPYFWLLLFFLLPFIIVLKVSFSSMEEAIPPYTPLYDAVSNKISLFVESYSSLKEDSLYLGSYLTSVRIAFVSTLLCLFIGYPMAYAIANARKEVQVILLLLILMPSWTAILIRVYAWMGILEKTGILNNLLVWIGMLKEPLEIINTEKAVYIGIVYSYLPFMILPLYANLVKHDHSLLEAASDLGAGRVKTFWRITVPLSKNGIFAGCMLVFIPSVGEFVIPELMGGGNVHMIGRTLSEVFERYRDWPMASALAVIMLAILIIPIILFNRNQAREMEDKS